MEVMTYAELMEIFDCINDGVFVTDGEGKVLFLNKSSEAICKYSREELIGKDIEELIEKGYFLREEVVSIKCIDSMREKSLLQKGLDENHELLVTAVPLIKDNKVDKVVVTERDVSQLNALEEELKYIKSLNDKYVEELKYLRGLNTEVVEHIVHESSQMKRTVHLATKAAEQDATVLIQGESGTGKEVIAKLIYKVSARREKPFITINCGAIPENLLESELFGYEKGAFTGAASNGKIGLFELANGGTLFLDEIGDLALHLQVKILRALQEKEIRRIGGGDDIPVDVRIIAATNINLKDAVKEGKFRSDLYYRLNVVSIQIEPLRHRREDIRPLAEKFLADSNRKYGTNRFISENGWKFILKYSWPGNVRELENFIERLIVVSDEDVIDVMQMEDCFTDFDFDLMAKSKKPFRQSVEEYERKLILSQMQYYTRTQDLADGLGINKSTLTRKMNKYGIENTWYQK